MSQGYEHRSLSISVKEEIERLSTSDCPKQFARISVLMEQHLSRIKKWCILVFGVGFSLCLIPEGGLIYDPARAFWFIVLVPSSIVAYKKYNSYYKELKERFALHWGERLEKEASEEEKTKLQMRFVSHIKDFESAVLK